MKRFLNILNIIGFIVLCLFGLAMLGVFVISIFNASVALINGLYEINQTLGDAAVWAYIALGSWWIIDMLRDIYVQIKEKNNGNNIKKEI
jgi:hypothetical protein